MPVSKMVVGITKGFGIGMIGENLDLLQVFIRGIVYPLLIKMQTPLMGHRMVLHMKKGLAGLSVFVACFFGRFIPYAIGQYKIIVLFVVVGGIVPRLFEVKREWHQPLWKWDILGSSVKLSKYSGGIATRNKGTSSNRTNRCIGKSIVKNNPLFC